MAKVKIVGSFSTERNNYKFTVSTSTTPDLISQISDDGAIDGFTVSLEDVNSDIQYLNEISSKNLDLPYTDDIVFDSVSISPTDIKNKYIILSDDDTDDDTDDNTDDDTDDIIMSYLKLISDNVLFVIDDTDDEHRDCYCKTRNVCGCGCDPLHDGW